MAEVFLHDPLAEPELLACILGTKPAGAGWPRAELPGHAVRTDADRLRLALAPAPGEVVGGRLALLAPAALARLDFALGAMGAARARVAPGGREAEAYLFAGAAPAEAWSADAWGGEWRAYLAEALVEVMGHFGRRTPEEMARLLHGIGFRALARARGPRSATPARLGSGLGGADVRPIARRFAYAGFFGVEDHRLRHRRFDGSMSEPLDRAVFTSGDAVTLLPYDPRRDEVLLIEQFRPGAYARRDPRPWFLEAVAGRCDALEAPEATARREAREEAGLEIGRIERLAAYYSSPGVMAEHITAFVGEADLERAGGTYGLADEHEDIRSIVVPLDVALAAAAEGELNNAPLLVSLFWLGLNRVRLAAAWS